MSLPGVYFDSTLIDDAQVVRLGHDHIDRHHPLPKTLMVKPLTGEDPWLTIDDTYPGQMRARYELLLTRKDHFIDRLEGDDVKAAEVELRDKVVDYLLENHPGGFRRAGDLVVCSLTGLMIDTGPSGADPMTAVALLASEDMVMMMPAENNDDGQPVYRLKSGALLFPDRWSLRSQFNKPEPSVQDQGAWQDWDESRKTSLMNARLGKTSAEIHNPRVDHYTRHFKNPVENFFRNMSPGQFFWRRNWGPVMTDHLSMHADMPHPQTPEMTPDKWRDLGYLRSEQQSFTKLEKSGAVVFGIKTYVWKLSEIIRHPAAFAALVEADKNQSEEMLKYRQDRMPTFRQMLANCAKPR